MKRVILIMTIIAATLVFILGQFGNVSADSVDKMCVMHKEGSKFAEKWVEPKSLDAHMRHGDKPCMSPAVTVQPNDDPELYFPNVTKRLDPLMAP